LGITDINVIVKLYLEHFIAQCTPNYV